MLSTLVGFAIREVTKTTHVIPPVSFLAITLATSVINPEVVTNMVVQLQLHGHGIVVNSAALARPAAPVVVDEIREAIAAPHLVELHLVQPRFLLVEAFNKL
jgi:hypothetical protein